jgi:hypothetical protein
MWAENILVCRAQPKRRQEGMHSRHLQKMCLCRCAHGQCLHDQDGCVSRTKHACMRLLPSQKWPNNAAVQAEVGMP